MTDAVRAWSEEIEIPTYEPGFPNKNPMFLEKRVYQGSSGAVYPYPVTDTVSEKKSPRRWTAVFLENRWIKAMILPEIGGRLQMAMDKTNDYHFVYFNQVIKPALVGLCGPWISGGIEFNWPQHHRPTTFDPVDWEIEECGDGSRIVWCSEIERMYRLQERHGFRLCPNRAAIEVVVRLYNRTDVPQTFLWWANPAVHVSDHYQSVFPPDVRSVMDHGKRAVSTFPIAEGTYYKVDYSPGTDISRFRNIPVPTSFMAFHSDYDFMGSYEHDREAGLIHVANHHLVPGKKQWTWGNGDFGKAWYDQLTDEDGPYVELMCGAFTDNQPDFSWLMPGEEKQFSQFFLPYKTIGPVTNATEDIALNLSIHDRVVTVGLYAARTGTYELTVWRDRIATTEYANHKNFRVKNPQHALSPDADRLFAELLTLEPTQVWQGDVELPAGCTFKEITVRISEPRTDGASTHILSCAAFDDPGAPPPEAARPAPPPSEVATTEELFLHGLHLEQYHHATYLADDYYREALERDPGDSRNNTALGLLCLRRGEFEKAERSFRRAVDRLTFRNPNPSDGAPFYYLGRTLALRALSPNGRGEVDHSFLDAAYDSFYKSTWNEQWKAAGCFEMAKIQVWKGNLSQALVHVENSLERNPKNHRAVHLKVAILRQMGRTRESERAAAQACTENRFNYGVRWEISLQTGDGKAQNAMEASLTAYVETGLDYLSAGMLAEACGVFRAAAEKASSTKPRPGRTTVDDRMPRYYLAFALALLGDSSAAAAELTEASRQDTEYAFPNQVECVPALSFAMAKNASDSLAAYALGNFFYAHRRYEEAAAMWDRTVSSTPHFATAWRNLAFAFMNKRNDPDRALSALERAYAEDPRDARVLYELDQLKKRTNRLPKDRLGFLEAHLSVVESRDDLFLERVALVNFVGDYQKALALVLSRHFHPWEGGEGKVPAQYVASLVMLAVQAMHQEQYGQALALLQRAKRFPDSLGEGKLSGTRENNIDYLMAQAKAALGMRDEARRALEAAATGPVELGTSVYYNDQPPEQVFYQGLAHRDLGNANEAWDIFERLSRYGRDHMNDQRRIDYFAVSLPDFLVFDADLERQNQAHCHFMTGLGYFGQGEIGKSRRELEAVLELQADHLGAQLHRVLLEHSSILGIGLS